MSDFVTPEPHRLTLPDGQFVDVRKRLNHGETEDMYALMFTDRRTVRTEKVVAYLIGWSLTKDGAPVPMTPDLPEQDRRDTIRNLDPDRFLEIHTAIEAHIEAMAEARDAQKKTSAGSPPTAVTSDSPSTPAGPSERSEP